MSIIRSKHKLEEQTEFADWAGTLMSLLAEPLATIVTLTVLFSVFAHIFSARPLVKWCSDRLAKAKEANIELEEIPEMHVRSGLMGPPGTPQD